MYSSVGEQRCEDMPITDSVNDPTADWRGSCSTVKKNENSEVDLSLSSTGSRIPAKTEKVINT